MSDRVPALPTSLQRVLKSEYLIFWLCIVLVVIAAPITPGFASFDNVTNVLTIVAPLLLVAIGQTIVMIGGGIDLSVTATIAVTSVCGASLMSDDVGALRGSIVAVPVALTCMAILGVLIGAGNGTAIALLRMPPFIVTLSSMMFLFGLATWFTSSRSIDQLPTAFIRIGTYGPIVFSTTACIAGAIYWLLNRSIFGRWLYAVGQNCQTATVSGAPTRTVIVVSYIICGLLAAIASVMYTAQLETGSPVLGKNLLLDIIGAVVIGGTSLFGGKGKLQWTLGGVLFITLMDNVLNLHDLSHFAVMIAKGTFILFAAYIDTLRKRWSDRE